jgi:hypothetical protein
MLAALKSLAASIAPRDVVLALGLALLGGGLYPVYAPAAAIVPGAILVAVAIFGVKEDGGEA